jgi:DNA-binding PucR family transcriptional regulator
VHPQTVRYRLGQLQELYGDRLREPNTIMEMTIALATADPSDFG